MHGEQWRISKGEHTAVVAQRGGAVRSYCVGGMRVIANLGDDEAPVAFHGAVLAPWPNRIRGGRWQWQGTVHQLPLTEPATDSALHGLLCWATWQPRDVQDDRVELAARILPQPGYPFDIEVTVAWSVSDAGLRCTLGASNLGEVAAPVGLSAHPYLTVGETGVDDLELTLCAESWLRTDERLHPVELVSTAGTSLDFSAARTLQGVQLDTAFTGLPAVATLGSSATLQCARGQVRVWADASFRWWQVYTSDYFDPAGPHFRRAVALEPMTCGPDAFNSGRDLIVLDPGRSWCGEWGVTARLGAAQ